tara:strand:+ start:1070 stop:1333 length:264 start_codon:yes stop_codon:yes gene_type:complete
MEKKKQELPKWFNGELYKEGDVVANRFTGEETRLTAVELSMYDFIMGATMLFEQGIFLNDNKTLDKHAEGLQWFRHANPEAYMILLD